jgi:hypothetical protein
VPFTTILVVLLNRVSVNLLPRIFENGKTKKSGISDCSVKKCLKFGRKQVCLDAFDYCETSAVLPLQVCLCQSHIMKQRWHHIGSAAVAGGHGQACFKD